MRRPLISRRRCSRSMPSKSKPLKRIVPPSMRALGDRMPSAARASVVLPQPDSPTNPMIWPRPTLRLTASSTRAGPSSVRKLILSSETSSNGSTVMRAPEARVEYVTQTVAQKIETHHHGKDGETRGQRIPPRLRQEFARLGDHATPFGCGRGCAQSQKSQGGSGEDRKTHADRGAHDDRREHIGKHMLHNDAPLGYAERNCRLDERFVLQRAYLGVDQAREPRPIGDRQGENHILD